MIDQPLGLGPPPNFRPPGLNTSRRPFSSMLVLSWNMGFFLGLAMPLMFVRFWLTRMARLRSSVPVSMMAVSTLSRSSN